MEEEKKEGYGPESSSFVSGGKDPEVDTLEQQDVLKGPEIKGEEKIQLKGMKAAQTKKKDLKRQLLQELSEEQIRELLNTKKLLEEKNKLLEEYEDLLKRKTADFENFRKRMQREMEDFRRFATAEMVLDIVNIIDDFERAIVAAKASRDFDTLLDGIILVEKQLKNLLETKYGVKTIEAVGMEFDPTLHDAIMVEESDQYQEDTVVENLQNGYMMYNRIIRPAKVKVAKAVSSASGALNNKEAGTDDESSGQRRVNNGKDNRH
ncbi:MAG: nucleotide exchange factor GrpE [Spirochaetota bacterium]